MTEIAFADCGGVTVMELGMAVMLMRSGRATFDDFAKAFTTHFKTSVDPAELRPCYNRLVERRWLEPHPTEAARVLVTETGENIVYAAFSGFVRLVDPDGTYFKASIIYGMTTRQHREDDDD